MLVLVLLLVLRVLLVLLLVLLPVPLAVVLVVVLVEIIILIQALVVYHGNSNLIVVLPLLGGHGGSATGIGNIGKTK